MTLNEMKDYRNQINLLFDKWEEDYNECRHALDENKNTADDNKHKEVMFYAEELNNDEIAIAKLLKKMLHKN